MIKILGMLFGIIWDTQVVVYFSTLPHMVSELKKWRLCYKSDKSRFLRHMIACRQLPLQKFIEIGSLGGVCRTGNLGRYFLSFRCVFLISFFRHSSFISFHHHIIINHNHSFHFSFIHRFNFLSIFLLFCRINDHKLFTYIFIVKAKIPTG